MKTRLLVAVIILVAAVLRMSGLWYAEFKEDEATNLFLAVDLVSAGNFPLIGMLSSIGTYNPPMCIYLLAVPVLISRNPVCASGYVALVNIAALYLCFLFCRRFFNERVSLVATAFFAVNPWAVLYSRKIWQQDFLPFFILSFLYGLYKTIIEKKDAYIVLCFFSLAVCTQLHLSSVYYFALLFGALLFFRVRIRPRYYGAGLCLFFLLYLPYALYDVTHDFYNLRAFVAVAQLPFRFNPGVFIYPFRMATTAGFVSFFQSRIADSIQGLLVLGGLMYIAPRFREKRYCLVLFWFIIPVLFLSVSKIDLYDHYFIFLYPVQFVLIGLFADGLCKKCEEKKRQLVLLPLTVAGICILYQLACSSHFLAYIRSHENIRWMGYGPPFKRRVVEIAELVREGETDVDAIHKKVSDNGKRFKYDFMATKYIVENLQSITESTMIKAQ